MIKFGNIVFCFEILPFMHRPGTFFVHHMDVTLSGVVFLEKGYCGFLSLNIQALSG